MTVGIYFSLLLKGGFQLHFPLTGCKQMDFFLPSSIEKSGMGPVSDFFFFFGGGRQGGGMAHQEVLASHRNVIFLHLC